MANVPVYDAPKVMPSGQPQGYQRLDTNPRMFGGGIAAGLQSVAQGLSVYAQTSKALSAEYDDAAANAAYVDFATRESQITADFLSTRESNAVGGYDKYIKTLADLRNDILGTLSSEEAKTKFGKLSQGRFLSSLDESAKHVANEHTKFVDGQMQSRVDLIINDSSTKFGDEKLFAANITQMNDLVVQQGLRAGWSPQEIASKQFTLRSKMWVARLNSMADADPTQAQMSYTKVRDGLTVEDRLAIEGKIQTSLRTLGASQAADRFMSGGASTKLFGAIDPSRGNVASAYAFLRPRLNPGHPPRYIDNLNPAMATRLAAMIQAAPPEIARGITIVSGARSYEDQVRIHRTARPGMAAKPGRSRHEFGVAVDIGWNYGGLSSMPPEAQKWIHENAAQFGIVFPMNDPSRHPYEPWHAEAIGARQPGGFTTQPGFAGRIESLGERSPSGSVSRAGAMGVMQVLPSTGRMVAQRLGIPFSPDRLRNDDQYNRLIGTTYVQMMLDEFGGSETLAAAAYNAGAGRVYRWLKQFGDPRKGEISYDAWVAAIPLDETRNYVMRVMGGDYRGAPAPVTASTSRVDFNARLADARAWAELIAPGDALFADSIETKMTADYNRMVSEAKAVDDEAYNSVMNAVITPDESGKYPQSLDEIPEELRKLYDSITDPDKKRTILGQLKTNASTSSSVTDENLMRFEELKGLYYTDREKFDNIDIISDPKLTQGMKKELLNLKVAPEQAINASITRALSVSRTLLKQAKISDKPKELSLFTSVLVDRLKSFVEVHKRQPTDEEILKLTSSLLTDVTRPDQGGSWDFWPWNNTEPLYKRPQDEIEKFFGPIGFSFDSTFDDGRPPAEERQKIIDAYTRKTGKAPTEYIINQLWLRRQMGELQ